MRLAMEYAWGGNGREPILIIYQDGARVASFDSEAEAEAWMIDEYGEDAAANVEIK